MRWIRHLFSFQDARRHFPEPTLQAIQAAVARSEHRHRGEICFAVESALSWRDLRSNINVRERAEQAFAQLRVWDTRENTGVLVYLLLAERAIEIVADRGVAAKVPASVWREVCTRLQAHCAKREFEVGGIAAVSEIGDLLTEHFPADSADNPDELPNRPVVLWASRAYCSESPANWSV
jgi:hypothetical protein